MSAIRCLPDLPFAEAGIGWSSGQPRQEVLRLDAYLPAEPGPPRPALVLAFGGAFHRGSKEDDAFPAANATGGNTAIAEYCRRFAALGFACFSIRYRLAGDDPAPSPTPVLTRPEGVPLGRIAAVRAIMGLPPATALEMARVMEAGIDDMVAAVAMVRARAAEFGVDPARVVLGGWSAGARCALYAAYAEGVACAGVIALSGAMQAEDVAHYLVPGRPHPPLLLFIAERDLDYVADWAPPTIARFRAAGAEARLLRIPDADHWYQAEAATEDGIGVQDAMLAALRRWTQA